MTLVFVHGNPETAAIWGPLLEELGRDDVILLSPPGFGAPVPEGFGCTHLEYRDWLADELGRLDGPVDLVGHDWGGGHVLNLVLHRPELVRSWVSDVVGLFDPDYVWHDLAQVWATPGAGEELIEAMLGGTVAERAERNEGLGMPAAVAAEVAAGQDEAMGRSVLALYRSAVQPVLVDAGKHLDVAAQRPGLAILATDDHFVGTEEMRRRTAARAGARVEVLEGLGHWWMLQDPARAAAALSRFWADLAPEA